MILPIYDAELSRPSALFYFVETDIYSLFVRFQTKKALESAFLHAYEAYLFLPFPRFS